MKLTIDEMIKQSKNCIWRERDYLIAYLRSGKYGTQECLFDTDDLEKIYNIRWSINKGYAHGKLKGKCYSMHRLIMDYPPGLVIHHLNHQTLDNRKENLRICTIEENSRNKKPKNLYKEITFNQLLMEYTVKMKGVLIGKYKDQMEALEGLNEYRWKNFGLAPLWRQ